MNKRKQKKADKKKKMFSVGFPIPLFRTYREYRKFCRHHYEDELEFSRLKKAHGEDWWKYCK